MHLLLAGFFPDIFWGWVMFPKSWWSGKDVWSGDMWMLRLSWSITTIVSLRLSLQYMQIPDAERNTSSEKWKWVFSSYIVWIDRISSTSYKTACLFRPDSCLLSALHLPLPLLFFFFSHYSLCSALSGKSWCWRLVNDYSGPLPHGEPDLLARFYGPFQSSPSLNTASCWPHGHNVVPCPSDWEKRLGGRGGVQELLELCQKGFTVTAGVCGRVKAGDMRRKRKCRQIWCLVGFLSWHPAFLCRKTKNL